jgi:trk system potassium uptake protein TrkH
MKPTIANLGFILQFAGIFTILPIVVAFYFNEVDALISLFVTSLTFLVTGFILNALCERKELDFKSSCVLISVVFFVLALIGTIPCLYLKLFPGSYISQFTNCYFECISGYTTTGLTLITDVEKLPKSILIYRSMTQFTGGIGIVFILLTFFFPSEKLPALAKALGIEKVLSTIKKSFLSVLLVYLIFSFIFIVALYFAGVKDFVTLISTVFSAISSGGFAALNNLEGLGLLPLFLVSILMILSAINFSVYINFFTFNLKRIPSTELLTFLTILVISSLIFSFLSNLDIFTSFFHVVATSTTTGFSFIQFKNLSEIGKILLITLMFIGGCVLSTAGGIKVFRLLVFLKSIPQTIKYLLGYRVHSIFIDGKELETREMNLALSTILLFLLFIFFSAIHFSMFGFPFIDSMFEVTSALATTGNSVGITNVSLPLNLKWNLILLMVLGRIEIIPFFVALARERREKEEIKIIE